jgi:hypothetical protein
VWGSEQEQPLLTTVAATKFPAILHAYLKPLSLNPVPVMVTVGDEDAPTTNLCPSIKDGAET